MEVVDDGAAETTPCGRRGSVVVFSMVNLFWLDIPGVSGLVNCLFNRSLEKIAKFVAIEQTYNTPVFLQKQP